jgi:3-keto-disaccharide hydrolase
MTHVILLALLSMPVGDNELTDQDKKDGWVLLWNGKDSEGWVDGAGAALKAEMLKEGAINPHGSGGHMVYTKEKHGNFVFACDFKVSKGCNSGVFFRTGSMKDPVQTGFEIQVFDSAGKEKVGKHDSGALYDIVAPSKNAMKPAGEWNHLEITANGSKVSIALNAEKVVECDLDQGTEPEKNPDGTKNKFKTALKDFAREGHFGLQDHGADVWFKNLKVKPLK